MAPPRRRPFTCRARTAPNNTRRASESPRECAAANAPTTLQCESRPLAGGHFGKECHRMTIHADWCAPTAAPVQRGTPRKSHNRKAVFVLRRSRMGVRFPPPPLSRICARFCHRLTRNVTTLVLTRIWHFGFFLALVRRCAALCPILPNARAHDDPDVLYGLIDPVDLAAGRIHGDANGVRERKECSCGKWTIDALVVNRGEKAVGPIDIVPARQARRPKKETQGHRGSDCS